MGLDIRAPIGYLFTILGGLLVLFGTFGGQAIYERSLNINVNLWWGFVMLVFGLGFVILARAKSIRDKRNQNSSQHER